VLFSLHVDGQLSLHSISLYKRVANQMSIVLKLQETFININDHMADISPGYYRVLFSAILAAAFFFIICNLLSAFIIVLCDIFPPELLAPTDPIDVTATGDCIFTDDDWFVAIDDDDVTDLADGFSMSVLLVEGGTDLFMVPHPGETVLDFNSDDDLDDDTARAMPPAGLSNFTFSESDGVVAGPLVEDRLLVRLAARPASPRAEFNPTWTPAAGSSLPELNCNRDEKNKMIKYYIVIFISSIIWREHRFV